jgi:hypothetical protein
MSVSLDNTSFVLLDYSEVKSALLELLLFDIIGFVGYVSLLYLYCVYLEGLVCALMLFLTQLVLGMAATRIHHALGMKTKSKTQLVDPSSMKSRCLKERVSLNFEDLKKFLEFSSSQIPEQQLTTIDDYNDIAWFTILIWSVLSSIIATFLLVDSIVSLFGPLITAFVCAIVFVNGYHSTDLENLRDNLNYLEFYVISRFSALDAISNDYQNNIFVERFSKNGKYILNDFGIGFFADDAICNISYYLGLPAHMNEQFEVKVRGDSTSKILKELKETLSRQNWSIEVESSENYTLLHYKHDIREYSFGIQNISKMAIDKIETTSKDMQETLNIILKVCKMQ